LGSDKLSDFTTLQTRSILQCSFRQTTHTSGLSRLYACKRIDNGLCDRDVFIITLFVLDRSALTGRLFMVD